MAVRTLSILAILSTTLGTAGPTARDAADRFQAHSFRDAGGTALPYRLFVPAAAGPSRKLPLVVALHGNGAQGRDNHLQLIANPLATFWARDSLQARFPAFVLAPQCPPGSTWIAKGVPIAGHPPLPAARAVLGLVDTLIRSLPVDPERIYLVGLSMGAHGAWELAMRHPDRYAAVVAVCGLGDTAEAIRLRDMPVWAFHGERDGVVPVSGSRDLVAAIRRAGGKPRYTEYAGTGHDAWTPALREPGLADWLFAQARRPPRNRGP